MGFPFINKPFEKWVSNKLDERANEITTQVNRYTPFIWLSSGAIVCNGTKPADIGTTLQSSVYKGCVLSNHIDVNTKYPLNDAILGYDLTGKPIKIEGEKGLKISPPIIESMEIDTDGENNTLKVATINVTIFSLKQLEMFELFFLKPSMTVVMEYGINNPKTKTDVAKESFINGKNWNTYTDEIINYFLPDARTYSNNRIKYLKKLEITKGDYDFWIGKVTKFNVSYEGADNVYKVQLEVSSGNELHLWMPIKQQTTTQQVKKKGAKGKAPSTENNAKTWMKELCAEMMLPEDLSNILISDALTKHKDEFFNWGKTNKSNNQDTASKEQYISFKLILYILNNCENFKAFDQKIDYRLLTTGAAPSTAGLSGLVAAAAVATAAASEKDLIIPINSHPAIISTNSDFIFPGKIPTIVVDKNLTTKVGINTTTTIDFPINGKSFNSKGKSIKSILSGESYKVPETVGNLLNVFVRKGLFISLFKDSYTFADFYESILNMINDAMFGLCKLEIGKLEDALSGPLTIVDKKLRQPKTDEVVANPYRFKIDPLKSIIHDMTFNLEMSNLMQAQALYESQLAIYDSKQEETKGTGAAFKQDRDHLKIIGQTNLDNKYSVDWVGYQINKEASKKWQLKEKEDKVTDGSTSDAEQDVNNKTLESVIKGKSIKFESTKPSEAPKTLIYQDYTLVQSNIINEYPDKTSVLTYLECDITIDGLAGFRCGELFNIDGVPEIYNKNGAFQILNIKQSVQSDTGWRTTINAGFRYNVK